MTTPILKPSPVDIVPAATVESIMADMQRELAASEAERVAAEAAADAAERSVVGGTDVALDSWFRTHLDRFVGMLRDEHEAEMRTLLDAAERRAQACIERAQLDADMLTSYAHALRGNNAGPRSISASTPAGAQPEVEVLAPLVWRPSETQADVPVTSVPPVVEVPPAQVVEVPVAPVVVAAPVVMTAPAVAPPPPAPPVVPVAPPAPGVAPVVPVAPPAPAVTYVPPAPAVTYVSAPVPAEATVVTGEIPAVPQVGTAGAPPAPPVAFAPPLAGDPPPPPPAPPVADAPAPVPAAGETKPQSRVEKIKALVHEAPTFAILQVLAVIVVLIIVLIRIG